MKKTIAILLVTILMCSIMTATAASGSTYFTDVPEGAWYAPYVDVCYESGLMKGIGDDLFDPEGIVTNGEMFAVCARIHSILSGGDGTIPNLPEGGFESIIYLTDGSGERISFFEVYQGYGRSYEEGEEWPTYFYLSDDIQTKLSVLPEDEQQVTLWAHLDKTYSYPLTYVPMNKPLRPVYAITLDSEEDEKVYDEVGTIVHDYGHLRGNWYDSAVYYVGRIETEVELWSDNSNEVSHGEELFTFLTREEDSNLMDPMFAYEKLETECFRATLAYYLATCIEPKALKLINDVQAIPDLDYDLLRRLYNMGILSGVDDAGTFNGHETLTRAQLATIIARVVEPELRIKVDAQ